MGANWVALNNGLPDNTGVQVLALDPINPSTLYAGTSFEVRMFKSTDMGANWSELSNGLTDLAVNALAIDPTSTLYTGTFFGVECLRVPIWEPTGQRSIVA